MVKDAGCRVAGGGEVALLRGGGGGHFTEKGGGGGESDTERECVCVCVCVCVCEREGDRKRTSWYVMTRSWVPASNTQQVGSCGRNEQSRAFRAFNVCSSIFIEAHTLVEHTQLGVCQQHPLQPQEPTCSWVIRGTFTRKFQSPSATRGISCRTDAADNLCRVRPTLMVKVDGQRTDFRDGPSLQPVLYLGP